MGKVKDVDAVRKRHLGGSKKNQLLDNFTLIFQKSRILSRYALARNINAWTIFGGKEVNKTGTEDVGR